MKPAWKFATCDMTRRLIDYATKQGWSVEMSKNNHLKFNKPGCPSVFSSSTPRCPHAWRNAISTLRRYDRIAEEAQA